jgi:hypothetical protein
LHRTAFAGNGAVEVHGLCEHERGRRLIQPEERPRRLAAAEQRGADLYLAEGDRDPLVQQQVEHHLVR